jgi:hypothetical protein
VAFPTASGGASGSHEGILPRCIPFDSSPDVGPGTAKSRYRRVENGEWNQKGSNESPTWPSGSLFRGRKGVALLRSAISGCSNSKLEVGGLIQGSEVAQRNIGRNVQLRWPRLANPHHGQELAPLVGRIHFCRIFPSPRSFSLTRRGGPYILFNLWPPLLLPALNGGFVPLSRPGCGPLTAHPSRRKIRHVCPG